jgi:hypothetical protein
MVHYLTINHTSGDKLPVEIQNINGKVHLRCDRATLPQILFVGTIEQADIYIGALKMAFDRLTVCEYIKIPNYTPREGDNT